jgi:predicted nucleotidyltransferase
MYPVLAAGSKVCRAGAANIRVCGSIDRGEARHHSDVDLVVDIDDDRDVLDLAELVLDLEDEQGRRVDVLAVSRGRPASGYSPVHALVVGAVPITAAPPERRPWSSGAHGRRLLHELRQPIALVRSYTQGGEVAFMSSDMARRRRQAPH